MSKVIQSTLSPGGFGARNLQRFGLGMASHIDLNSASLLSGICKATAQAGQSPQFAIPIAGARMDRDASQISHRLPVLWDGEALPVYMVIPIVLRPWCYRVGVDLLGWQIAGDEDAKVEIRLFDADVWQLGSGDGEIGAGYITYRPLNAKLQISGDDTNPLDYLREQEWSVTAWASGQSIEIAPSNAFINAVVELQLTWGLLDLWPLPEQGISIGGIRIIPHLSQSVMDEEPPETA